MEIAMKRMKRMLSTVLRSLSTFIPLESGDMLSPRRKSQLLKGKMHSRLDKHHASKIDLAKAAQHSHHHQHSHH
jgi:hypothetical protein